jgi:hypothetical protein
MKDRYAAFSSSATLRNLCTAHMRRIVLTGLSLAAIAATRALAHEAPSEACSPAGTEGL